MFSKIRPIKKWTVLYGISASHKNLNKESFDSFSDAVFFSIEKLDEGAGFLRISSSRG